MGLGQGITKVSASDGAAGRDLNRESKWLSTGGSEGSGGPPSSRTASGSFASGGGCPSSVISLASASGGWDSASASLMKSQRRFNPAWANSLAGLMASTFSRQRTRSAGSSTHPLSHSQACSLSSSNSTTWVSNFLASSLRPILEALMP